MLLQSLEAIALIGAKSAGRISESCMHVACRFIGAAGCYTHELTHRRIPPLANCSLSCSDPLGEVITETTPLCSHSKPLDKSESNSSNFQTAAFLLLLHCNTGVVLTLLPPVSRSETKLSRVRSQNTPTLLLHLQLSLESLFLATLLAASTNPQ